MRFTLYLQGVRISPHWEEDEAPSAAKIIAIGGKSHRHWRYKSSPLAVNFTATEDRGRVLLRTGGGCYIVCSQSILTPIAMRTRPPTSSALDLKRSPTFLPKSTPAMENSIVVIPIIIMGIHTDISRKAKETPTARASILVATARVSMCQNPQPPDTSSSSLEKDSFTILAPINVSRNHATQWSH